MRKIKFNPKILSNFFDIKVRDMCRSCKRYGKKATCPPHVESVEYYKNLLSSYKYGILYIEKFLIDNIANWERLGQESSLIIHKAVLNHRNSLITSINNSPQATRNNSSDVCRRDILWEPRTPHECSRS